jgi:hypothetical protein
MCWWIQDKWLLISESRNDSNWCISCKRNLIHTTRTLFTPVHVCHSNISCKQSMYMQSIYMQIFHADPIELDGCTTPKKKCSRLHLSAQLSGPWDPSHFLSQHNYWSSAFKPNICWRICYIGLLGTHLQYMISTFNTFSWGSTHRHLIDTSRGYNLGDTGFPHHSPCPFQHTVIYFPLRAPFDLHLTNYQNIQL